MKKLLLSLIFTGIASVLCAQSSSDHLTFKGIPIDGTLSEFTAKMKNAGFSYLTQVDDITLFNGDFAGFKNCTIVTSILENVNVINMVGVVFPLCDDWSSLERNYETLKSMLTQKYGEPAENTEQFDERSTPDTNDEKLLALCMDRCTWYTIYETPQGEIQLFLEKGDMLKGSVILRYYDRINTAAAQSAAMSDL